MTALTELQQVNACKKEVAAKLSIGAWLESTWSDLMEADHLASILCDKLEDRLDANGVRSAADQQTVTLRFQRDDIDQTIWLASRISSALNDLDARMVARINQTVHDEAAEAPTEPRPSGAVDLIRAIDNLTDAEDRCEGLLLMAQSIENRSHSAALERVISDVLGLVMGAKKALEGEGRPQHG